MPRVVTTRVLAWIGLASFAIVLAGMDPAIGQDATAAPDTTAAEKAPVEKPKKFRGRLPNYYRQVVDEKQREAIYRIQEDHASKIAALKAQLEALTKQRDEQIAALLTAEQRQKVQQLGAAAKAKREQKRSAPKKTAQ